MKLLLITLMLSSVLLGWQKQIILGSYGVQSNGERALKTIDKEIASDIQLKDFMKEYSLRVINTEINSYTVVSVNAFESFTSLVNTMNVLKVYYPDAYILKYPTQNIAKKENLAQIQEKAIIEQELQKTSDEYKRVELKKLLEEDTLESTPVVKHEPAVEPDMEVIEVEEAAELTEPVTEIITKGHKEKIQETEPAVVSPEPQTSQMYSDEAEEYILYLLILAAIALFAAGITVIKIAGSKSNDQQEDV